MSASLGLEIVRSWQAQSERLASQNDDDEDDRDFNVVDVDRCFQVLRMADRVFQRLGPNAGLHEVASQIGTGGLVVDSLFQADEDLRLAYKIWTYESVVDHIRDEIDEVHDGDKDVWKEALRSIWERFEYYAQAYCQFDRQYATHIDLIRRTVDMMTVFFERGSRAGAFAAPDVHLAAYRCVDVLSRPLTRPGTTLRTRDPDPEQSRRVSKARAAQLKDENQDQRFSDFLIELEPYVQFVDKDSRNPSIHYRLIRYFVQSVLFVVVFTLILLRMRFLIAMHCENAFARKILAIYAVTDIIMSGRDRFSHVVDAGRRLGHRASSA